MANSAFKRVELPEILPVDRGGTGTSDGSITGTDNLVLTPGTNKIIKLAGDVEFLGNLLPDLTDTRSIGSATKFFKDQFVSQINATIFAENTISLLGGWFVVGKNQIKLPAITSGQTQIDFGTLMTPNDFIVIRSHDASGTIKAEYLQVGTLVSGTTYNVTRDVANMHVTDPVWSDGTPALVLGNTGDGRIEMNAYDSPRISIITQGNAYNTQTEVLRIGDLNGIGGISTQKFGIYIGTTNNHLQYNSTDDSLIVTGSIKATSGYIGGTSTGWSIGSNILSGGSGATYIALDQANSKIRIGAKASLSDANTGVHLGSDGLALGANSVFVVTAAGALTATNATITGAITATSGTFTGAVNANTGTIGGSTNGWQILAGEIRAIGTGKFTTSSTTTRIEVDSTGLKAYNAGTQRVQILSDGSGWLGSSTDFSWTNAGVLSVNRITATTGTIGGWVIDADQIISRAESGTVGTTLRIRKSASVFGSNNYADNVTRLEGFGFQWYQSSNAGYLHLGNLPLDASGNPVTSPNAGTTGWYGLGMVAWNTTVPYFQMAVKASTSGSMLVNAQIAGWKFDTTKLYNATGTLDGTTYTTTGMVLGSSGYIASPKFRVTTGGILYATEANISGVITATSGTFTGTVNASGGNFTGNVTIGTHTDKITIAATSSNTTTAIYAGTGTYGNTNTGFFMDASGRFSLKDKLTWDGTTLTINGGGTFSGALSAASGSFAGSLSAVTGTLGALTVNGTLTLGTGTIASTNFNVTSAGVVTATSATITGTINATGGYFGTSSNGWNISSNTITANGTGLFQTSASANTGIKINSTAIAGYNGTAQTLNLATDGSGWVGLTGTRAIEWTTAGAVKIAGWNLDAGKLYNAASAGAVYTGINSTATGANKVFYTGATAADGTSAKAYINADGSGALSNGAIAWDNAGNITAVNKITAGSGSIGGFTIHSTDGLYAGTGATRVQMKAGAGFWAGADARDSAPFRVTEAGALTATSATITGVVTANTGYIGGSTNGWQIFAGEIRAIGTGKFTTSSTTTRVEIDGTGFKAYNAGTQRVQILNDGSGWLGSSSDFSWTNAGVLSVNKVTATSGTIAGWSIDSGKIYSSNTFITNTSTLWSDQSSRISAAVHSHNFATATYSPALSGSYSGTGSTGSVATYVAPANGYWKLLTNTDEIAWSRVTSTAMAVTAGTRYLFEFTLSKPSANPQAAVVVEILNSSDVVLYSTIESVPSNYTYTYKIVYTPAVASIKIRWTLQTSEQSSEVRLSLLTIKGITPFVELSDQGLFIYTDPTTMTKLGAGLVDISSIKNTFNFNVSSINSAYDYVNLGIRTSNDVYNEPYKIDASNSTYPLITLLGNGANGTYAAIRLFSTDATYGHSVFILERPNRNRLSAIIHKSGVSEYNTQWVVGTGLDNSGNNSLGWGVSQDLTLANVRLFITGGSGSTKGYIGLDHTVPANRLTLYGGTTAAEGIGFAAGSRTTAADTVLYRGAAGQLVLEGTDSDFVLNSPTSTVRSQVTFKDNGTAKAYFGVSFSTNGLVNGSVDGDFCIRTQGGKILLSTDSGSNSQLTIESTGITKATGLCRFRGANLSSAPSDPIAGDIYIDTGGSVYIYDSGQTAWVLLN